MRRQLADQPVGQRLDGAVLDLGGLLLEFGVAAGGSIRQIGALAGLKLSPEGQVVSEAEWQARQAEWLPTAEDRAFVASLMGRVVEPGKFANWISPPVMGINRQPVDFEYVRFN